jgi:recombination protein RecA
MLDLAVNLEIIEKSGSWYAYNEERIGQGRENAKRFLTDQPEMCLDIENKVRMAYGMAPATASVITPRVAPPAKAAEDVLTTE